MCVRPARLGSAPRVGHHACRCGFARKRGFCGAGGRAGSGLSPGSRLQSGLSSYMCAAGGCPSGAPSKPSRGIYLGEDMGGGVPSPRQWLRSAPHHGATLPVRPGCGVFVNSHVLFCYGYKAFVFIRCCDLRYTNPLKKHQ